MFVRCDNRFSEFGTVFQYYFIENSIILELLFAYKYSINSVIKYIIQFMNQIVRFMIYKTKIPYIFWCFAIEYVMLIKNCVLIKVLFFGDITVITSYEMYKRKKLDIKDFKVFEYKIIRIYFKNLY